MKRKFSAFRRIRSDRKEKPNRTKISSSESVPSSELPSFQKTGLSNDILGFDFHNLNLPEVARIRMREQFNVRTIADFFSANEQGVLIRDGLSPRMRRFIEAEVVKLIRIGSQGYITTTSREGKTFLQLIAICRESMKWQDKSILDHHMLPITYPPLRHQELGIQLDLSAERVRQLEHQLAEQFRTGEFRDTGWHIRVRTIDIFPSIHDTLSFETFLSTTFFSDLVPNECKLPAPINFLKIVFPSTFLVDRNTICLRVYRGKSL